MAASRIVVVAEVTLDSSDIEQIAALYGQDTTLDVLVAVTDGEPRVIGVLNHLALGQLGEAWSALRGREPEAISMSAAANILRESLAVARAEGMKADGQIVPGDLIAALVQSIDTVKADGVVLVTLPHLAGDALHQDWSAKARRTLGVPVIHFYGGTTKLLS
ncbi:MAG: hypothetical protein LBJ62_09955 [Bifidobacteriaceae bacterium]|jgi:hypothetical protein|nr:hypothetical protein [Bifidobacteriaceae bacterium]